MVGHQALELLAGVLAATIGVMQQGVRPAASPEKALREKPLKVYEVMKRANVLHEKACQSLLLKMRDEGLVKFDIRNGRWLIGRFREIATTV